MMSAAPSPKSHLDYALDYAARGWHVIPLHWITQSGRCSCGNTLCRSEGKHPYSRLAQHGSHDATVDPATITRWWTEYPDLNIGVATGEPSGIVVIDIDPRNGGDTTWQDVAEINDHYQPDTCTQATGGGGLHYVFAYDPSRAMKKLGPGIDFKSNGGYIAVEPSNHISGGRYAWHSDSDPLEGAQPAPLPAWVSEPKRAKVLNPWINKAKPRATGIITPERGAEIMSALEHLDSDPREVWLQVGMALHSTDAPDAFEYWDAWAQTSPKYDQNDSLRTWASFREDRADGIHIESLFRWAYDAGWAGTKPTPVPVEALEFAQPVIPAHSPDSLLSIPGALQACVAFHNASAPRPQPALAVACALALGSVACARKYRRMPGNNWTSLYFVTVALSSAGKEHSRTVIDQAITAADWPEIMGRSGFTSDAGVVSALLSQPAHINIQDEFGAILANLKSEGAYQGRSAVTSMVEAWGACHGTMRPKAYSTMTLTQEQADEQLKKVVHNPGLSLLGLTTPTDFFGAMSEQSIKGGFLSRLIVVEGQGRQPAREVPLIEVPDTLVDWLKACKEATASTGNLSQIATPASERPTPIDVPTDPDAKALFKAYELETLAAMDELEERQLAELEGRSVEKAMRIALILSVSVDPHKPRVTAPLAQWAINYVRHHTARLIEQVELNVHAGKFAELQSLIYQVILAGGKRGRTERELANYCRPFMNLTMRERRQVLDALNDRGTIAFTTTPPLSGRGKARQSWVAVTAVDRGSNG